MTIKTDTQYNFHKAESDLFAWDYYDGTNGAELQHKPSGRKIYQMHWLNAKGQMAERVEGEICEQVKAFWSELGNLQKQKPPKVNVVEVDPEPKHGVNGYCRKCHSYCYGDCTSH